MLMGVDQLFEKKNIKNGHALHIDAIKKTKKKASPRIYKKKPKNDFLGVNGIKIIVKNNNNNPTTKKHDNIITIKARTPGVASAIL